jgi:hypothetical protein
MDTYISGLAPEEPAVDVWSDPFPAPLLPLLPEVYPIVYTGAAPRASSGT